MPQFQYDAALADEAALVAAAGGGGGDGGGARGMHVDAKDVYSLLTNAD